MSNCESLAFHESSPALKLVDLLRGNFETALEIAGRENGRITGSDSGSFIKTVVLPISDENERMTKRIVLAAPHPQSDRDFAEVFAPIQEDDFEVPSYFYVRTHVEGLAGKLWLVDQNGVTDPGFDIEQLDITRDPFEVLDRTEDLFNQISRLSLVSSVE